MKKQLLIICLVLFCGCSQKGKYQAVGAGLGGAAAYFGANTEKDSHKQAAGAAGVYAGVQLANKLFNDNKQAKQKGYQQGYIDGYKEATAKQMREEWNSTTGYKQYAGSENKPYTKTVVMPAGQYNGIYLTSHKVEVENF